MSDKESLCPNMIADGDRLYTKNLTPGISTYGEQLESRDGVEYRKWDPHRSKLAAYIKITGKCPGLQENDTVLYLGASTGTTVSHVSDIIDKGHVYAVEISKRTFRLLLSNCEKRKNVIPMLGDARDKDLMEGIISRADYLYIDIAQRDEVNIFLSSMSQYRCRTGMLMLKCRSIDVTADPKKIAKDACDAIASKGYRCDAPVDIGDFEKDHFAIFVQRGR